MIKETEQIVMYDSPEAATYRTDIKGWVNSSGQYWNDEHMARWTSCTHMTCSCGKIYEKGRVRCRFCQAKKDMEDYYALPMIEWDGESPVCDYDGNTYFFDHESVMDILFYGKTIYSGIPFINKRRAKSKIECWMPVSLIKGENFSFP